MCSVEQKSLTDLTRVQETGGGEQRCVGVGIRMPEGGGGGGYVYIGLGGEAGANKKETEGAKTK